MDERKFRILQAIIDDYILTAIPVGSRTISKKYDMGLSSATIRNEMSDLEELGYLAQPHVSSGRIPSAKAYRLYVDQLLQKGKVNQTNVESLTTYFKDRQRQMEDVIGHAAKVISGMTNYTSLVTGPSRQEELCIRNLQLVKASSSTALVIIVTNAGVIRDQIIRISPLMDDDALYVISRMLSEMLIDNTLSEASVVLSTIMEQTDINNVELMSCVKHLVDEVCAQGDKQKIVFGGTSNILNFPEYNDAQKAKEFFSVLETKEQLISLMQNSNQMEFTVHIGPETGIAELENCSLITASYRFGNNTQGSMGVIGPTRMQYGKVMGVLQAMGQQLTSLFTENEE